MGAGCTSLRKPPAGAVPSHVDNGAPTVTTYHQQPSYNLGPTQLYPQNANSTYKQTIANQIEASHGTYIQPHGPSYAPSSQLSPTLPPPPTFSQQSMYNSYRLQNKSVTFGNNTSQQALFNFPRGPSTQEYYQHKYRR